MSTVKASNVQFGNAADNMNFTWSTPTTPDGTIKFMRGSSGNSIQDLLTVNASNTLYLPTGSAPTKPYTDNSTALATTAHVYGHRATAKAWVVFRPFTGAIMSQYNVSAVTRTSVGNYLITMNAAAINGGSGLTNYIVCATGGEDESGGSGGASGGGVNNVIFTGVRTSSTVQLLSWEATSGGYFEDPGIISVVIFGA